MLVGRPCAATARTAAGACAPPGRPWGRRGRGARRARVRGSLPRRQARRRWSGCSRVERSRPAGDPRRLIPPRGALRTRPPVPVRQIRRRGSTASAPRRAPRGSRQLHPVTARHAVVSADSSTNCAIGFDDIVIDLRTVTFIDSSGLRLLLAQARACRESGSRFRLVNGPAQVRRLFEISGTRNIFEFIERPRP